MNEIQKKIYEELNKLIIDNNLTMGINIIHNFDAGCDVISIFGKKVHFSIIVKITNIYIKYNYMFTIDFITNNIDNQKLSVNGKLYG